MAAGTDDVTSISPGPRSDETGWAVKSGGDERHPTGTDPTPHDPGNAGPNAARDHVKSLDAGRSQPPLPTKAKDEAQSLEVLVHFASTAVGYN